MRTTADFARPGLALCTARTQPLAGCRDGDEPRPYPDPAAAALSPRPKLIAVLCIGALAGAGWIYLGLMAASAPGTAPFDVWPRDGLARDLLAALCRPAPASAASPGELALVLVMWGAMVLAMMLPTAAPMVLTYAEIAETAAQKGEPVASPLALVGGYATVWLGFALAATALQWLLTRAALLDPTLAVASGLLSGAVFVGAGAYQFSALKHACLTLCQRPFPFFFANWTTTPRGLFRLGLRQGVYCVGCCWAMMLVMFAVGAMNVVWMAALGIVMALEKIGTGMRFTRAVGAALVTIGVVVLALSVAAHWPARASPL